MNLIAKLQKYLKIISFSGTFIILYTNVAYSKPGALQAPLFDNLGDYHHPVSTHVPLAQRFFDQGLTLYYGFEWGESIRSFREATRLDPMCGMCYWGLALAIGSKINAPVSGHEYRDAKNAIDKAMTLTPHVTPVESAYIRALALRFQHRPHNKTDKNLPLTSAFSCHISNETFDTSSKKEVVHFAEAMKNLVKSYPFDSDAKTIYAYALFQVNEWEFWTINGKKRSDTNLVTQLLDTVIQSDPNHIGANHYYIHLIEPSPKPENALSSANLLKTLVPGSEHLVHMPTHIYFLTGRYQEGTESNLQAISAFKQYNKTCREQGFEPATNYLWLHNFDFLRTTATLEGRKQLALSAVHELLENPFPNWLANELSLQWFIPISYFVKARFGMWVELLKEPKPNEKYQYAVGMWHYARGIALINHGDVKNATQESVALSKVIMAGPTDNTLQKDGIDLLKIAHTILDATLADYDGKEQLVFSNLKKAEQIQYQMGYHEPPDWYFPVNEALGDAYLKWQHPQEAKILYEKVLHQYPKNGWALYGLANSLRALGEDVEASRVDGLFKQAWKYADIPTPIPLIPLHYMK